MSHSVVDFYIFVRDPPNLLLNCWGRDFRTRGSKIARGPAREQRMRGPHEGHHQVRPLACPPAPSCRTVFFFGKGAVAYIFICSLPFFSCPHGKILLKMYTSIVATHESRFVISKFQCNFSNNGLPAVSPLPLEELSCAPN